MQISFQTVKVLAELGDHAAENVVDNWGALTKKDIRVRAFWSEYTNKFNLMVIGK